MAKKIIVTGAAGFIGSHLSQTLVSRGHEVVGIDNFNNYYSPELKKNRPLLKNTSFDIRIHNVEDASKTQNVLKEVRPDAVVHLAAQPGVRYSLKNPASYIQSNVVGHSTLLEACRQTNSVQKFIYASSSSVYGNTNSLPFSEDQLLGAPLSLYAASKQSCELISQSYSHMSRFAQVGLRFFSVYGPWGRPDMAYWMFSKKILDGEPITLFNNGKITRDFTYIDDIVEGLVRVVEKCDLELPPLKRHRVFNIGNGTPRNLSDLVKCLEKSLNTKALVNYEASISGEVANTNANTEKFKKEYNYKPSISLEEGLQKFSEWFLLSHPKSAKEYAECLA